MKTRDELVDDLLDLAFAEDIGDGDHTTLSTIPADEMGKSRLIIKEPGVLAGVEMAEKVLHKVDPSIKMEVFIKDGSEVKPGDIAFIAEGPVRSLLTAERTMLNIMQRMSGVATMTATYQNELKGLHTKVLDTRKTTPGMRILEKDAVAMGGGKNHRIGLFDMILIKDNHIDFAGVDRIMFDNFTPELTKEAVKMVNGAVETESSGGITLKNLRQYGEAGVDFISVGALTHSVKGLDLSFKAC